MDEIGSQLTTKINKDVLESYLHCKYKGYLKLTNRQGTESDYETLHTELRIDVRLNAINKTLASYPNYEIVQGIPLTIHLLRRGPLYLFEATLEDDLLSLCFDGLKKVAGPSHLGDFHYIPILFYEGRKIRKQHKLLLELYSLFLSKIQGRSSDSGIIWHGREYKVTKVRLSPGLQKAELLFQELIEIGRQKSPPPMLILNDHCPICEFHQRCHAQAHKEDNISLLKGMGMKEIKRLNRKGIFTVTQLSCTFIPRKKTKRAKRHIRTRYFALQAMAIRDKKIYVYGMPRLPISSTRIYVDLEGDPEEGFVYLIGVIIDDGGIVKQYSFWANDKREEGLIFQQLIDVIASYHQFNVFYYGSYEAIFLRRMRKQSTHKTFVDKVIFNSFNVLSVVYSHIYFPAYSNRLKDIGTYLGCTWSGQDATGIQSIVWRKRWESTSDVALKRKLITYNSEDVQALRRITENIYHIIATQESKSDAPHVIDGTLEIARVEDLGLQTSRREYGKATFVLRDFEHINKCAYFNYQREKVFLRTHQAPRTIWARKGKTRPKKVRFNKRIQIKCRKCPFCGSTALIRSHDEIHIKLAYDLKISDSGIRKQVIECTTARHRCLDCGKQFLPRKYKRRDKHCHALKSWAIYQHVVHRISFEQIGEMFKECFSLHVGSAELHMTKTLMAKRYWSTYKRIVGKILCGDVIHIDETQVNLQRGKGYVWVLANWEEVAYLYRPTREGDFLQGMLKEFKGVLISDFYSAYDSLPCEQQKCLVHLIRDLNHDLQHNPYDEEYKSLAGEFGRLLRVIVSTIDKYGLKRRHLNKHVTHVDRFFRMLESQQYHSELAESYQKRLLKNRKGLFTFLQHDGVPWNNNSAEHALHRFAYYRTISNGKMTELGLEDYLILLSTYQTCRYKGISFLKFLLSRENDIDRFIEQGTNKRKVSPSLELYPEGFSSNHPRRRTARIMPTNEDEWTLREG
jgi:predicted RecB family nuclease